MKSLALDRARYSSDLLRRVKTGWRQLANHERYGVLQAARITAELSALGAPPSILTLAAHVVQEKVRHLEVCGRVIDELGPDVEAQQDRADRPARAVELTIGLPRASVATEMRLARVLVSEFALGKPLTAAAFATARAIVREPLMAWAYTELLHDETRHATFGAKAAAWVVRHWSPAQRQALWASCLSETATPITARPIDPEAATLGLLPAEPGTALPAWILPHLAPLSSAHPPSNNQALLQ